MPQAPPDVLQDIFLYLDRNEVEKSHLVNNYWKSTITKANYLLPLRLINELKIVCQPPYYYALADGRFIFDTGGWEEVRKRAENLRVCVVKNLTFDDEEQFGTELKRYIAYNNSFMRSVNFQRIQVRGLEKE